MRKGEFVHFFTKSGFFTQTLSLNQFTKSPLSPEPLPPPIRKGLIEGQLETRGMICQFTITPFLDITYSEFSLQKT